MTNVVLIGDALEQLRTLPDESVQCCVTSPPYWGLRDYAVPGQLGLEKTPDEYVAKLVEIFREVKRVLRSDGVLWLNLGDSYSGSGKGQWNGGSADPKNRKTWGMKLDSGDVPVGLKPKDLVGIPWRVAFALQADGWWLRQDIIWDKVAPMPESVRDRCTKSHEYIFLLTKSARYFFDAQAIAEPVAQASVERLCQDVENQEGSLRIPGNTNGAMKAVGGFGTRNARDVWRIAPKGFSGAHFATFPPEIPERCIKAGTSERGCCPECGSPWERVVESKPMVISRSSRTHDLGRTRSSGTMVEPAGSKTIGWRSTCDCGLEAIPQTVFDPFAGSGTTLEVAKRLGRNYIGIELNEKYVKTLIEPRLAAIDPLFS